VDGSAATPAIRGTDTNTGIFFPAADTIAFAEGGVEAMRLDASGNLGVGTTSPLARLDVVGSGTTAIIGSTARKLFFAPDSGGVMLSTATAQTGTGIYFNEASSFLYFQTNSVERARIDTSGKFLVGTTSGGVDKVRIASAGVTENQLGLVSTDNASNNGFIQFRDSGGTSIGSIARNGSSNAVLYNTTSDYRLKEQVTPMSEGLAKVMALKPVKWVWKDCNGATGEGFIAHEVQEVVPSAVSGEKDAVSEDGSIKPQGMDASYLVATLTAAIQEQQAIITALTAQVAALDARLISLEGTQP
jgi:hypothetical protein